MSRRKIVISAIHRLPRTQAAATPTFSKILGEANDEGMIIMATMTVSHLYPDKIMIGLRPLETKQRYYYFMSREKGREKRVPGFPHQKRTH
jgi:hypothetical protein